MALTTRPLPSFERFLPEPVEYKILTYLPVRSLHAAIQVSKTWGLVARDEKLWTAALGGEKDEKTRNQLHDGLFGFLITSIREKQYDKISRWITIGAKIDKRCQGTVEREFPLAVPAVGHFHNPTVLSIAANLLSGQEGINVVRLLLHHGANVFETSDYSDWTASPDPYGGGFPPIESNGFELPSKSACDSSIKTLLHLAEFERELSRPDLTNHRLIVSRLENAYEADEISTRQYVTSLILKKEAKDSFQGIQQELKSTDLEKLTDEQYRPFSEISFFQQYWQSLLAAAVGSLYAACFKLTIDLGAFLVGLFTSAAVPPAMALIFGVLTVGLMCGIAYTLLKKAWDYYHHVKTINLPQPAQQPKPFHGGLFFKPKPSAEQKDNKSESVGDLGIHSPPSRHSTLLPSTS